MEKRKKKEISSNKSIKNIDEEIDNLMGKLDDNKKEIRDSKGVKKDEPITEKPVVVEKSKERPIEEKKKIIVEKKQEPKKNTLKKIEDEGSKFVNTLKNEVLKVKSTKSPKIKKSFKKFDKEKSILKKKGEKSQKEKPLSLNSFSPFKESAETPKIKKSPNRQVNGTQVKALGVNGNKNKSLLPQIKEKQTKKKEIRKIILPKPDSIYETDFDRIFELVEKENIVKVSEIAEAFDVDKSIVMRWGDILNEHEVIDFHIPAFGEPEFRKKGMVLEEKKVESKKKKLVINLAIIGIFLIIVGGFFIIRGIISSDIGNKPSTLRLMPPETAAENTGIVVSDMVKKAFSGNGSYTCRDGNVRYYIKDQLLRADGIDRKSTVIIKEGFSYIYDINRDIWIKSEVKKDIVLPGSGKLPNNNLNCKEEDLDISVFNIPEGKIE